MISMPIICVFLSPTAKVKALGIVADSNNFAMDFIYTDAQGGAYHDDPQRRENWYGYGRSCLRRVQELCSRLRTIFPRTGSGCQATKIQYPKLPEGKDPNDIGNFVLIDHGESEFSLLIHLKPGSVRVKPGEQVARASQWAQSASPAIRSSRICTTRSCKGPRHEGLGHSRLFLQFPCLMATNRSRSRVDQSTRETLSRATPRRPRRRALAPMAWYKKHFPPPGRRPPCWMISSSSLWRWAVRRG